jgi:hypothetical protein
VVLSDWNSETQQNTFYKNQKFVSNFFNQKSRGETDIEIFVGFVGKLIFDMAWTFCKDMFVVFLNLPHRGTPKANAQKKRTKRKPVWDLASARGGPSVLFWRPLAPGAWGARARPPLRAAASSRSTRPLPALQAHWASATTPACRWPSLKARGAIHVLLLSSCD